MGNVNMNSDQIHYRNNSKPSVHKVGAALDRLFTASDAEAQDIIDLTAAMTAKADKIDIAPTFSAETAYFEGDMVFQSGRLWKFTTNHDPGEWNQEEVIATNIDLAIKSGSGSAYSETLLYSGTGESTYALTADFDTFDAIMIQFERSNNIRIVYTYPASFLSDLMTNSLKTGAFSDDKYFIFTVTSKTLLTKDSSSQDMNIVKIYGITY